MSIITCPECGREISDRAQSCPGCGYPVSEALKIADAERKRNLSLFPPEYIGKICVAGENENSVFLVCGSCGAAGWESKSGFRVYSDMAYSEQGYSCKCGCSVNRFDGIPKIRPVKAKQKPEVTLPKCPVCGSVHVQKISGARKVTYGFLMGFYALKTMNSTFKCTSCGYKF